MYAGTVDVDHIVHLTQQFLQLNPNHPERDNIKQYTEYNTVNHIIKSYQTAIQLAQGDVIDMGSGIGVSKILNPSIELANMEASYFIWMEKALGLQRNYTMFRCQQYTRWSNVDRQFDTVLLLRFLPWFGETLHRHDVIYKNILTEVHRILKSNGKLLYSCMGTVVPNLPQPVIHTQGHNCYVLTKENIADELFQPQAA
jgi:hypothetical protein